MFNTKNAWWFWRLTWTPQKQFIKMPEKINYFTAWRHTFSVPMSSGDRCGIGNCVSWAGGAMWHKEGEVYFGEVWVLEQTLRHQQKSAGLRFNCNENKLCHYITGMEEVISKSRNFDELTYVWKAWRDASGAKMRDDYKKYVELSNLAAQKNGALVRGFVSRKS